MSVAWDKRRVCVKALVAGLELAGLARIFALIPSHLLLHARDRWESPMLLASWTTCKQGVPGRRPTMYHQPISATVRIRLGFSDAPRTEVMFSR